MITLTADMIPQINAIVEEMDLAWEYEYIGVRIQNPEFELGTIDHVSHRWDDGVDTGEELDGICTLSVKALPRLRNLLSGYIGEHVAIICGNYAEYGEDDGEIIIRDAEVVSIIC